MGATTTVAAKVDGLCARYDAALRAGSTDDARRSVGQLFALLSAEPSAHAVLPAGMPYVLGAYRTAGLVSL